jgi:hypothetical protein
MTTISFFQFKGIINCFWAFKSLGTTPKKLEEIPGLIFYKIMGSGGQKGFGIIPNFGVYSLLCTWESTDHADAFFKNHQIFNNFKQRSIGYQTIFLSPLASHGTWDGKNPFPNPKLKTDGKVAVITRGRIKKSKLWKFWQYVGPSSEGVNQKKGVLFSIGIGELPIIQQATFSIWENTEKMVDFAYKSKQHTQVIQKTKELNWYSEELFARFSIIKSDGNWVNFENIC